MKKSSLIYKTKVACLGAAVIGFAAFSAQAAGVSPGQTSAGYVLGSWQSSSLLTSTDNGWVDNGSGSSIYYGNAPTTTYSIVPNVVTGYAYSLQVNQSNYHQSLKKDFSSADMTAFYNNTVLSFQFSVPASTATGGWNQIYQLFLNAPGFGFNNLWGGGPGWSVNFTDIYGTNNNGTDPNYYYGPATSVRSELVTINYTGLAPVIQADEAASTSGQYLQLIFAYNTGGGAPSYSYLNNVVLTPEPTTGAMILAGGAMALFLVRRRTRKTA